MQNTPKEVSNILHNNSIETSPGLTIDDLNRYLPAVQSYKEINCFRRSELEIISNSFGLAVSKKLIEWTK